VAASLQEQVIDIEKRLALIEVRLEQLFEHLNIAPRGGGTGGGYGSEPSELDPNDDPEIQDLLAKGNETQAIKRYGELTGLGLAEAKAAIERAQADG
jgi:ribosomal protein L7/L12